MPVIASNDALYADPSFRDVQDVLTCIREGVTIDTAGRRLESNGARHLKAPAEMARLFADCPAALDETQHFLGRIGFDLAQLRYEYPDEPVPPAASRRTIWRSGHGSTRICIMAGIFPTRSPGFCARNSR